MSLTIGQRIQLIAETEARLRAQLERLSAELESIQRELGLDIPKEKE